MISIVERGKEEHFLYIKGIKELLSEVNSLKVYMEGFREKIIEIHTLVYPALANKFGVDYINEEEVLETLFFTIAKTDFNIENSLRLSLNGNAIEPIYLNEEDSLSNPYLHFHLKNKLYCIGINDYPVWKTLYGNELKIKEMSTKHLENSIYNIRNSIDEMQKVDEDLMRINKTNNHSEKVLLSQLTWLTILNHELSTRQELNA